MDPYYTGVNLLLYGLSIGILAAGIPLLVFLNENIDTPFFLLSLGSLLLFPLFLVLSRTCPYPGIQEVLVIGTVFCLFSALVFGFFYLFHKIRSRSGGADISLFQIGRPAAHRWIMESLSEFCLITDPQGRILSCGRTCISVLEPNYREKLFHFLSRALESSGSDNPRNGIGNFLDTISVLKAGEGEIDASGASYKWVFCPLGEEGAGHLLYFTDQTKEKKLIRLRREQGRLLKLKNDWLREQGEAALNRKNIRGTGDILKRAANIIEENLMVLREDLLVLVRQEEYQPEDLERLISESRKVMTRIRETIHALPYEGEKKEIL